MTKTDLLELYKTVSQGRMPGYVEVTDANWQQLLIDGKWQNRIFSWTILFSGGRWKYAETDSERGYVVECEEFDTETEAVEYAKHVLNLRYLANRENSTEEMLCRFICSRYGTSEERAASMVSRMVVHKDIFEEFFSYARTGRYCSGGKPPVSVVCGYTAELLAKEYGLSALGAYNYLVYLREEPEQTLRELHAKLPRK